MTQVTRILSRIEAGESLAAAELLPLVYEELRRLAAQRMTSERPEHTLSATALVHEAYLRLIDGDVRPSWDSRGHFFAAAAESMRRILVEQARKKATIKRGGGRVRVELGEVLASEDPDRRLLELDAALRQLATEDPLAAQVVELRYFSGLGHEGVAATLGITNYAARQKWTYARAWLRDALQDS